MEVAAENLGRGRATQGPTSGAPRSALADGAEDRLETNPRYIAGIEWIAKGYALLPIGLDKQPYYDLLPRDRHGRASWSLLRENPANEEDLRRWLEFDPECNLGLIVPENRAVIDLDEPARRRHMPLTPRSVTRRGTHTYCSTDSPLRSRAILNGRGRRIGELKGAGSVVLLPPSRHPDGHIYCWAELMSPSELGWTFAPLPSWVTDTTTKAPRSASRNIPTCTPRGVRGRDLADWDRDEMFVRAASRLLGIPAAAAENIGRPFRCVLPGHDESHPSASLYRTLDGKVLYRDWHAMDGEQWYTLAEVRASQAYGRATKLHKPEQATWHLRLLVETGYIKTRPVQLPPLGRDARPAVRKIHAGFKLLLECKWRHSPGSPTAFSWRFAAAWTGLSQKHASESLRELLRTGHIRPVGRMNCGGRTISLFLPGTQRMVNGRRLRAEKAGGGTTSGRRTRDDSTVKAGDGR